MRWSLFPSTAPSGFHYLPDWITVEEEKPLLSQIERLSFSDVRMHGVTAKRRVVHFGWDYGYASWTIEPTEPIPDWLMPLRLRAGALMGVPAEAVEEVLVTRYEPGARHWMASRCPDVRSDGRRCLFSRDLPYAFSAQGRR